MKKVEVEEEVFNAELGGNIMQVVEKFVRVADVDDSALVMQARLSDNSALQYAIYYINQAAPRVHRREIFNILKKNFPEYLDSKEPQKDIDLILKRTEDGADMVEDLFIRTTANEETMPLFDFDINPNEGE